MLQYNIFRVCIMAQLHLFHNYPHAVMINMQALYHVELFINVIGFFTIGQFDTFLSDNVTEMHQTDLS